MPRTIFLGLSPHLDPLPELAAEGRSSIVVDPDTFGGWDDVFTGPSDFDDYLLAPGDYRGWGKFVIRGANPADHRRVIRFVEGGQKPWDRTGNEAVTAGFEFGSGAAHWAVHGLTSRGPSVPAWIVRPGAEHITFDSLLIEDFDTYGVRLLGNHCTVQNSVIRRMSPEADGVAVQIRVSGQPNVGNRVLDNEIYDCNDGVSVTWDKAGLDRYMECRALVVEGNDLYLTESRHVVVADGCYATAENGMDIKAGPRSTTAPLRFVRNRIWGFRRTVPGFDGPSSDGAAVSIHRGAQRILFEGNIIFDCPIAFHETARDKEDPNRGSREITVRTNIVSLMRSYNAEDPGAVLRTVLPFRLERNIFSHSKTLSVSAKQDAGDDFVDNVLYDTSLGEAQADWIAGENNRVAQGPDMDDVLVERRRWTNRSTIMLRSAGLRPDV